MSRETRCSIGEPEFKKLVGEAVNTGSVWRNNAVLLNNSGRPLLGALAQCAGDALFRIGELVAGGITK